MVAAAQSADYFAIPALSFSGMKDLSVSPLRYWHLHINPNRPERRESPEMRFGSALHCAVLEPDAFTSRYCVEVDKADYPGCLETVADIRQWITDKGQKPKGTLKADLVNQALAIDSSVPILDLLVSRHAIQNAGKVRLSVEDWTRCTRAVDALMDEPSLAAILNDPEGRAEVPMLATDPSTGVPLKAKLDWVTPSLTLDVKTFSQQRGKSIDKSVHDAIYYEHYNWQAYHYTTIRTLNGDRRPRYLMAFVESEEPHEVRLKELRPTIGNVCMYWERARIEVRNLIDLYAECQERFGAKPWRTERSVELLTDENIPQLAYA